MLKIYKLLDGDSTLLCGYHKEFCLFLDVTYLSLWYFYYLLATKNVFSAARRYGVVCSILHVLLFLVRIMKNYECVHRNRYSSAFAISLSYYDCSTRLCKLRRIKLAEHFISQVNCGRNDRNESFYSIVITDKKN